MLLRSSDTDMNFQNKDSPCSCLKYISEIFYGLAIDSPMI